MRLKEFAVFENQAVADDDRNIFQIRTIFFFPLNNYEIKKKKKTPLQTMT